MQAPNNATARRRAIPPRSRWSSRLLGVSAPDYRETGSIGSSARVSPETKRRKVSSGNTNRPSDPRSIKNLKVDLDKLENEWLGKIIPPQGEPRLNSIESSVFCEVEFLCFLSREYLKYSTGFCSY